MSISLIQKTLLSTAIISAFANYSYALEAEEEQIKNSMLDLSMVDLFHLCQNLQ
ncbi:MAG UNVERIFIED_CONTAM: hypothetical protein LVQ98_07425 [Rickettsiaceae bacterium]|jgi:hypothetical protein